MTDSDPLIVNLVIGVAFLTVVTAVEYASLRGILKQCTADDAKKTWKDQVYAQVTNLRKQHRDLLVDVADALKTLSWNLFTATCAAVFSRKVLGVGGTVGGAALVTVLVSIQVLYYDRFDFDVIEYLSGYSVPAILLSLVQVIIVLALLSFAAAAGVIFLFPLVVLLLIWIVNEMHLVAMRTLSEFLFACRHLSWCRPLVSSLQALVSSQDSAPADSASKTNDAEDQQADRSTPKANEQNPGSGHSDSPVISFIEDYGSKLFKEKSESEFSQRPANRDGGDPMPSADVAAPSRGDNPPTSVSRGPEDDKNDSKKKGPKKNKNDSKRKPLSKPLSFAGWLFVTAFFVVGILIALYVEPRYRAYAVCNGPRTTRVVLDPPLQGQASFTRIGSIGGHVFIMSESSCGRSEEKGDTGEPEDHQAQAADEETETNGAASVDATAYQRSSKNNEGNDGGEDDGDGGEPIWKAVLPYVPDPIRERLSFFYSAHLTESRDRSTDVTVVPLSRVLCMYEVRDDRSSESAVCSPVLPPSGDGPRILVHKTQENTWKIVIPSDVRIRIEDERLLTEEIEQEMCDGGAAEISEPVLFKRCETTPLDTRAVTAFLNRLALQEGVKLHVLGFASGDGNRQYNKDLARQRAEAVAEIVENLDPDQELVTDSWGETHLTNGVANSRSVRIVGCRPEAGDSGI